MRHFNFIHSKLSQWLNSDKNIFHLSGINPQTFGLYLKSHFEDLNRDVVLVVANNEDAEDLFDHLHKFLPCLLYPEIVENPYSSIIPNEKNLLKQIYGLDKLLNGSGCHVIITTLKAMSFKTFDRQFFDLKINIGVSDILGPRELAQKLVKLGYSPAASVEEPGTFSQKGEIFDLFPISGEACRIIYYDDMIEEIYLIDLKSGKTLKDKPLEKIIISPSPHALVSENYVTNFRGNILKSKPGFKEQYRYRNEILGKLGDGVLFNSYINYLPLFFEKPLVLQEYLKDNTLYIISNKDHCTQSLEDYFEKNNDLFIEESENPLTDNLIPEPDFIFNKSFVFNKEIQLNEVDITLDINKNLDASIDFQLEPSSAFFKRKKTEIGINIDEANKSLTTKNKLNIINNIKDKYKITVLYKNPGSIEQIKFLLENNGFDREDINKVFFDQYFIDQGFFYKDHKHLFLSESDFFVIKKEKTKVTQEYNFDIFAEQFSSLAVGDYVVHRDFGLGKYQGMEKLMVGTNESDCIVINYDGGDKVYVPVYKFNLIQKHADLNADLKLSNLNSKKFQASKSKAKQSIKKLAFDLLKIQAQRETREGYIFSPPDETYIEFEETFPFKETPDQLKAIEDVIHDMTHIKPMDRLICGDVGFGKTEIAMRAAFKAVLDHKQVAILVPTTILAYQHYHSFLNRMKDFAINVELISRFRTAKQTKEIIAKLEDGKVDIVIGTHKLLSNQVQFKDLGLVIIDEEHRFGVNHKEKLKDLKNNVDVITMTATPIPRTLQLSFLGIRDLSIIKTPPPRRQSIKSYLIKEDDHTIKEAISKEIQRGGQVYYVYNRVRDINDLAAKLKKLVPSASFLVAHGQLTEVDLEKKVRSFYNGEYDVLVSTTIIESGIDIPRANTMIVHNAQNFGLAQLHQLRGRIGRSDRKAYAYFMVPKGRELGEVASKRLKALQTFTDMGSGFSIATSDLEIRGAGDILGAEQSGHIEEIGLEYYMDLLKEAIRELKGELKSTPLHEIEIKTPFASQIPMNYIENDNYRLKTYKRLSNADSFEDIDEVVDELQDQFGLIPQNLNELVSVLKVRVLAKQIHAQTINVTTSFITIYFDKELLTDNSTVRDNIIGMFLKEPGRYKVQPNYSVKCHFKSKINHEVFLNFVHDIAQKIKP